MPLASADSLTPDMCVLSPAFNCVFVIGVAVVCRFYESRKCAKVICRTRRQSTSVGFGYPDALGNLSMTKLIFLTGAAWTRVIPANFWHNTHKGGLSV